MSDFSFEQLEVCARFDSGVDLPAASDGVDVALSTLSRQPLNALRSPAGPGRSGWRVWGGVTLPDAADFGQALRVDQVGHHAPALVHYLALEPGWRVRLAVGREEVWFDRALLAPRS